MNRFLRFFEPHRGRHVRGARLCPDCGLRRAEGGCATCGWHPSVLHPTLRGILAAAMLPIAAVLISLSLLGQVAQAPAVTASLVTHQAPRHAASGSSMALKSREIKITLTASAHRFTTPKRLRALAWAETQKGKPYEYGGTGPWGYDCSGLVMMAYRHQGYAIPRTTYEILAWWRLRRVWHPRPGDLAFYGSGHVELVTRFFHTTFGAHDSGSTIGFIRWGYSFVPTEFFRVIGAR